MSSLSFFETYERISSADDFKNSFKKDINKICKFCSNTSTNVDFKNIPHIIPELLGRNNYTCNEECDSCNTKFGRYETDLSNYISPYQTLIGQKTKNKIPSFQGRVSGSYKPTLMRNKDGKTEINFGGNLSDFKYDYKGKILNLNFKKKKFIPVNVYRSFVKIALSLCSKEELQNYDGITSWLLDSTDNMDTYVYDLPLHLFRTRFENKYYTIPTATLYKRRKDISIEGSYIPNLCLIVNSGVFTFQLFIPFCQETKAINTKVLKLRQELYPAFILGMKPIEGQDEITIQLDKIPVIRYDMNCFVKVEEDEIISLKYENLLQIK